MIFKHVFITDTNLSIFTIQYIVKILLMRKIIRSFFFDILIMCIKKVIVKLIAKIKFILLTVKLNLRIFQMTNNIVFFYDVLWFVSKIISNYLNRFPLQHILLLLNSKKIFFIPFVQLDVTSNVNLKF